MKSSADMVLVALNGRVVALDRDCGELLWQVPPARASAVTPRARPAS
jgi:hypothetical protein